MNVEAATMTMPRAEAREAYRAYKAQLKSPKATREDVLLYRAYRALVRGCKIIDVNRAIGAAGFNARGLPKLAICLAPAVWCHYEIWTPHGHPMRQHVFSPRGGQWAHNRRGRHDKQLFSGEVAVPVTAFATAPVANPSARAHVPLIPPQHRPTDKLEHYHVLWEANWEDVPVDPLLLKHIDGPFYVVLAAWDLTLVEQSVLRMRV